MEKEMLEKELRDTQVRLEAVVRSYEKCIETLEMAKETIVSMEEERSRTIDRKHALDLMDYFLGTAKNEIEEGLFSRFKTLIEILPSSKQLDTHVYCTECANFSATETGVSCPCSAKCYFVGPEDSAPLKLRWLYAAKSESEVKEND